MVETTARPVRVMLVEDNPGVRRAVAALLQASGDLTVCGESATVADAGEIADTSQPDVVVIDLRLPDGSGIEAGRTVRAAHPEVKVMLLTSASEEEALVASVLAGASGYLVKQLVGTDLAGTVRAVAAGETLIDGASWEAAVGRISGSTVDDQGADILTLVAERRTDRQIADDLGLDESSVHEWARSMAPRLVPERRSRPSALRPTWC